MNFDDAIKAHFNWKSKLKKYLQNPDGSVNAKQLAQDDLCELGRWIHGEGQKFAHLAEFRELVQAHAEFHKVASGIVTKADSGKNVSEEVALGGDSDYSRISTKVVQLIMKVKLKAAA